MDTWLAEMQRIAVEPGYLARRERLIASGYRMRSWDDVAHDVSMAMRRARHLHLARPVAAVA